MKKLLLVFLLSVCCLGSLEAVQILLLNKTGKGVTLSFSFFHTQAKKEMAIHDFALGSMEKTKYPQDKDMGIALPTKLKVKVAGGDASVSMTFDQNDQTVHDLEIIEYEGVLKLAPKKPAETGAKKV